jgi:cyclohexanone monooxygenase
MMPLTNSNNRPAWFQEEASLNADALRTKYREERDKRLRAERLNQYQSLDGSTLQHYSHDKGAKQIERDPIDDSIPAI